MNKLFPEYQKPISALGGAALFYLVPALLIWLFTKYADESEIYKIGEEAEDQAINFLHAILHKPWVIIHNFEFPERRWGDIDIIAGGQGGVYVFEVKGFTNTIRNIGDKWEYKNNFGWWKLSKHPGKQARRNASRLNKFLDSKGATLKWIQPVVI